MYNHSGREQQIESNKKKKQKKTERSIRIENHHLARVDFLIGPSGPLICCSLAGSSLGAGL